VCRAKIKVVGGAKFPGEIFAYKFIYNSHICNVAQGFGKVRTTFSELSAI
jgi:hypothetical protein